MRYYSKTTGTTYLDGVHTDIPADAVDISEERYQQVIANPEQGKIRSHDDDGLPILIDRPPYVPTREEMMVHIDSQRDERISSGFEHGERKYRSRAEDRASITENANLAAMAIMNGAQPGELNWLNDDEEFQWIDADNERVPMDAQSMINLARSAATHKNRLVFAARTLKDMSPIPADFADDKYWS